MFPLAFVLAMQLTTCDEPCRRRLLEAAQRDEPLTIAGLRMDGPVDFEGSWKPPTTITNSVFEDLARFRGFDAAAQIQQTRFSGGAIFTGAIRQRMVATGCEFQSELVMIARCDQVCSFRESRFDESADFDFVHGKTVHVGKSAFQKAASFRNATPHELIIIDTRFEGGVDLSDATIVKRFLATNSVFSKSPQLARTRFWGEVRFDNSSFPDGLDLRFADFSDTKVLSLDGIRIEPRLLRFRWDDIRPSGKRRIDVNRHVDSLGPEDDEKSFPRLVATYELLATALGDQGNDEEADRVRYELEVLRQRFDGTFMNALYGFFFGFGYAPWRVTLLAVPLMLFFAMVYAPHRDTIAQVLDGDVKRGDIQAHEIRPAARVAHLLFFSTAVLLGIRFKSEWIRPKEQTFLLLVTAEWLLGIGLYILFFAAVKTSGFAYVKGLLGF